MSSSDSINNSAGDNRHTSIHLWGSSSRHYHVRQPSWLASPWTYRLNNTLKIRFGPGSYFNDIIRFQQWTIIYFGAVSKWFMMSPFLVNRYIWISHGRKFYFVVLIFVLTISILERFSICWVRDKHLHMSLCGDICTAYSWFRDEILHSNLVSYKI